MPLAPRHPYQFLGVLEQRIAVACRHEQGRHTRGQITNDRELRLPRILRDILDPEIAHVAILRKRW